MLELLRFELELSLKSVGLGRVSNTSLRLGLGDSKLGVLVFPNVGDLDASAEIREDPVLAGVDILGDGAGLLLRRLE